MTTALEGLLVRLRALFEGCGVPFMVAGSFASTAHGVPRTTQDIDIVIDPPDLDALDALIDSMLVDTFYVDRDAARDAFRRRSMFNVVDMATAWKVDLILRKNRPFSREEFSRRSRISLLGVDVFAASAEDTIIAKLEWSALSGGSERQRRDVAGIVATLGLGLDRAYIERWVEELRLGAEWAAAQNASL